MSLQNCNSVSRTCLMVITSEDLTGRVTVTNGQRLFKFQNISIPNGDFSVKYLFPYDGTHQVLLRLEGKNKLNEIASFNVFVPHQGPPSVLDPFMGDKVYPTIIIIGILSGGTYRYNCVS